MKDIFNYLINKGWIQFLLSFIFTVLLTIFIPEGFYERLPFENHVNVIFIFAIILFALFLVFYGCTQFYIRIKNEKTKQKIKDAEYETKSLELRQCLWNITNNLSPLDKAYILEFIKNGNQPIEVGNNVHFPSDSLFLSNWVISTEVMSAPSVDNASIIQQFFNAKRQYKLKEDIYVLLKHFYEQTGKICDFE